MPVHRERDLERGFDQAALLARRLAATAGLPYAPLLVRRRRGRRQSGLGAAARAENVREAFQLDDRLVDKAGRVCTVLVVDDVYTTGETLHACSLALRHAGCEPHAFTFARAARGFRYPDVLRQLRIVGNKGAAFMKIQVKGRHVVVTEPLRDYAEEKLAKLHRVLSERHIDEVTRVELELIVEKGHNSADSQVAEATVFTRGPVMRARESSPDMYASIDLVTEKLQRQAKKYHDKVHHKALRHTAAKAVAPLGGPRGIELGDRPAKGRRRRPGRAAAGGPTPLTLAPEPTDNGGGNNHDDARVVKSKQFALKPMSVDEATLQLELIGHSFFVFTNAESGDTNVVYRRNDGDYGLIEPLRQ